MFIFPRISACYNKYILRKEREEGENENEKENKMGAVSETGSFAGVCMDGDDLSHYFQPDSYVWNYYGIQRLFHHQWSERNLYKSLGRNEVVQGICDRLQIWDTSGGFVHEADMKSLLYGKKDNCSPR